ncbi:hypothetical protein L9F63_001432 [Diploptera punctata]|uniref:Translation initiation factor IF-3 n=1 Tax=Diploptera punctata TaxID=6984 RepID=A0AAD8A485_DIPPU|nr:hypothetical protein L9F63_001432 [Diploptera punctata]
MVLPEDKSPQTQESGKKHSGVSTRKSKDDVSPHITLIGTDNNPTVLTLTDAEKLRHIKKWLLKSVEVRIIITGEANNMTNADQVYKKIEENIKADGRIVQKRVKGNDIRFQILPPKKTKESNEALDTQES